MMKANIKIQNLKCGGCANTIKTKLNELSDIENVDVVIDSSEVSFNYTREETVNEVKTKLKSLGYPALDDENGIVLKAKSFISCATGKISK